MLGHFQSGVLDWWLGPQDRLLAHRLSHVDEAVPVKEGVRPMWMLSRKTKRTTAIPAQWVPQQGS